MGLHQWWLLLSVFLLKEWATAGALSCNWGTQSTHPLPPNIVVKLMRDNGFTNVKLFEAEPGPLKALGNSGIQVMLGIPNNFLAPLASSVTVAEQWVAQNVSAYVSKFGVDIRYVAVGNEPFLETYKDKFLNSTFPAMKNIQAALIKAGLGRQVKVTIPLNADVYQSPSDLPSGGDFRPDIRSLMLSIVKFLANNASPLTINIYPFLSLYADPNFPVDFAFFPGPGGAPKPLVDGSITYTNVFDANYDTLISALEKHGFGSLPVIVGEVGWPTDGDPNANNVNARRFNQGLIDRINRRVGTPKRPKNPPEVYIFALIDEDAKSVLPGRFERHWGIFAYDGTIKYKLDLGGNRRNLTAAKGVRYLDRRWCVAAPGADLQNPNLPKSVDYACSYADCTSLGFGSSCGKLDARSNASYAFNQYFQALNQQKGSCEFSNMSMITKIDPSQKGCRFGIMIDLGRHEKPKKSPAASVGVQREHRAAAVLMLILSLFGCWML